MTSLSEMRGDWEGESGFIHEEGVIRGRGIGGRPEAADPWQEPPIVLTSTWKMKMESPITGMCR
jgi:hypothetical protein